MTALRLCSRCDEAQPLDAFPSKVSSICTICVHMLIEDDARALSAVVPEGRDPRDPPQVTTHNPFADQASHDTPSKQRDGDQILPDGTGVCVQDRIIADMYESKRVGLERYGQTLRTFNGRRGIQDVHEEVRDLFVYLTQMRMESDAHREALIAVVRRALWASSAKTDDDLSTIAVDRVMGWVTARLAGSTG